MLTSLLRVQPFRPIISLQTLRNVSQMRQVKLSWLNGPSSGEFQMASARFRIRKRLDELLREAVPYGDLKQLLLSSVVSDKPYTLERATDRYLTQFERPTDRTEVPGTESSIVSHEYYNARKQRYEAKLNNSRVIDPLSSPQYLKFFKELRRDHLGISRLQKAYFALPRPAPLYMQAQDLEFFIRHLCNCPHALRKDTFGVHFLHDMHQSGLKLGLGEFFKLLDSLKGIVTLESVYGMYKQQCGCDHQVAASDTEGPCESQCCAEHVSDAAATKNRSASAGRVVPVGDHGAGSALPRGTQTDGAHYSELHGATAGGGSGCRVSASVSTAERSVRHRSKPECTVPAGPIARTPFGADGRELVRGGVLGSAW
ncbi:hypothetical protein KL938_004371 [Ogataea parapolymorpha]|nr:hypothetical protein KL938_004371 [Ogataea parapolymorpha]